MSKKQQIAEQEAALNWYAAELGKADKAIWDLEREKKFLNERINALESVIDEKQALTDLFYEVLRDTRRMVRDLGITNPPPRLGILLNSFRD